MRAAQTARSPRREGSERTVEKESWRAENTPRHVIDLALSRAKLIKATEK